MGYIRLLSKFVDASYDCNGVKDGTAFYDACGQCAGGTTGIEPEADPNECAPITGLDDDLDSDKIFEIYPNPGENQVFIRSNIDDSININITDITGKLYKEELITSNGYISISELPNGTYFIVIKNLEEKVISRKKFIKN